MYKVFRGVFKEHSNNVEGFKQGLRKACEGLIPIINESTQAVGENGYRWLVKAGYAKILAYSYSKSVAIALKRLGRMIGKSLQVYVCDSGKYNEGYC